MKKLGLVGGMGPESTIPYYHDIVYGVQNRAGGKMFPNLTIESVDVFKVLKACGEGRYDELTDYLSQAIQNLVLSGADFVALSANTPHIVFDRLAAASPIPLISIVTAACNEAVRRKFTRIGLLGTSFTMMGDFFKTPFIDKNIDIIVPAEEEMEFINNAISNELELGIVHDDTLKKFITIINNMKDQNDIQAIILGCTELPLLLNDSVSPVPCLDTMKIHVNAIINMILNG